MDTGVEYNNYPIFVDSYLTDHIVILCSNMRQPIKIARASTLYSDTYDNYDIIDPSCTNFLPAGRNIICLCRVRSDDTIGDALLLKCSWEIPKQNIVKTLYVNEEDNSISSGVMLQVIDKRQPQSHVSVTCPDRRIPQHPTHVGRVKEQTLSNWEKV